MKKKDVRKLTLNKETLNILDRPTLEKVAGGTSTGGNSGCGWCTRYFTCQPQ